MIFLCRLNVAMIHLDGKQVSYINILVFQHGRSFYALFYRVETVLLSYKKKSTSRLRAIKPTPDKLDKPITAKDEITRSQ